MIREIELSNGKKLYLGVPKQLSQEDVKIIKATIDQLPEVQTPSITNFDEKDLYKIEYDF